MEAVTAHRLPTLTESDITPIVRQIVNQPDAVLIDWHMQKLGGGTTEHRGRGRGLYRLTGTARIDSHERRWSLVLKLAGPSERAEQNNLTHPDYWKREVFAYQSGVLTNLPGSLVAVRCYGVDELPDGMCRIWLEDVHGLDIDWTMDHHRLAARHLGQFNGAYLAGYPLPEHAPWMLLGRTHQWVESMLPDWDTLLAFSETNLGRAWYNRDIIHRMMHLREQRHLLLDALDRLPLCFCHHDAFRRNLFLRPTHNDALETVAIDWSFTGPGRIGQEIGITTAIGLFFLDVPAGQARALDEAVFDGYCAGLRDAGWDGDLRLARFGYAVTAALTVGVAFCGLVGSAIHRNGVARAEQIFGLPIDVIMAQMGLMHPFLLDLGDEALDLLTTI